MARIGRRDEWISLGLTIFDGDLIVGGTFSSAGGVPVSRIARWDGTEWHALGSGIRGSGAYVDVLAEYRGGLVVGGEFTLAGGLAVSNVARWDGRSWGSLGSGTNDAVQAFAIYSGELQLGGEFTIAGGEVAVHWARWGSPCASSDINSDGVVNAADLAELLAQWGSCHDCDSCPADLNGDCVVGPADLAELLANWG